MKMWRGLLLALLVIGVEARAEPCPAGQEATDYPAWKYVANNAARTADAYAVARNPKAVFARAEVVPYYQAGGPDKGRYLVQVLNDQGGGGVSLAMLRPTFDFCASPQGLDDEGKLFEVVSAKFNGRPF
ncbi:MAG: hypothetical protein HQL41_14315 [Alphaproteobacteria bacterium]|nr:hypothetical protein [Alphaproteobacteria bacterium]